MLVVNQVNMYEKFNTGVLKRAHDIYRAAQDLQQLPQHYRGGKFPPILASHTQAYALVYPGMTR